jgi:hypothetical protein
VFSNFFDPGAVLRDLNVDLAEIPAEAYASLLTTNLQLGTNLIGQAPADVLAGSWTGPSKNNELGIESTVDLVFDDQGNFTDYFQRGLDILTLDLNYVDPVIYSFAVGTDGFGEIRPVASSVETNSDGSLLISSVSVQDLDLPTGRSRFQYTATTTAVIDDANGRLNGAATIVTEVINSAVPGTEIGEVLRSTHALNLERTDVAPGLSRRVVADFNQDVTTINEEILRGFLSPGLQLGANISGDGDRSFLTGLWSGEFRAPSVLGLVMTLKFDPNGRLTSFNWSSPIPTELNFAARLPTEKLFENGDRFLDLPLASNSSAENASSYFIEAFWLTDGTVTMDLRDRYVASVRIDATPNQPDDTLTVATRTGIDRIASQIPAVAPGISQIDFGESTLDRILPSFVDADATNSIVDLGLPIGGFDDETLGRLLPDDLPIGASTAGSTSAAELAGSWSGVERRVGTEEGRTIELRFDESGALAGEGELNFSARDVVTTTIDLETRSVKPLASCVQTDDGVRFRLVASVLVDSVTNLSDEAIQRRTIETTIHTVQLNGDRLMGTAVTTVAAPGPLDSLFETTQYESRRYDSNLSRE